MPRLAILAVPGRRKVCSNSVRSQSSHPFFSKRRPKTVLNLRLVRLEGNQERPLARADVTLTDERSVTVMGRSDSTGRITLSTGRSVVPIGRIEVCVALNNGECLEGEVTAEALRALNVDTAIHCNSTIVLSSQAV